MNKMVEKFQTEARSYGPQISRDIKDLSEQISGLQERAFCIYNEITLQRDLGKDPDERLYDVCAEADQELKRLGQILNHVRVRCEKIVLAIAPIEETS